MSTSGWIGVDLDGTLAFYDGWKGGDHIGPPVPAMLERVKQWLADGVEVKIFTARASEPALVAPIEAWCERHLGQRLPVTNIKDFRMIALYDDRAIQVKFNTGRLVETP